MSADGAAGPRRTVDVRIPKAAELVATEIRRQIVSGQVGEGEPLPNEADLMSLFGVSRPTIREALRVLEADGLVEVKRGVHGGPRVRLPDASVTARHAALLLQVRGATLVDLAAARRFIEPPAVRALAGHATGDDLDRLRAAAKAEREAGEDYSTSAHLATLFHSLLVELTGNATLSLLNELLIGILDTQNRTTIARVRQTVACDIVEHARSVHDRVIDLIEAGDGESAERLWTEHLDALVDLTRETFGMARMIDIRDLS